MRLKQVSRKVIRKIIGSREKESWGDTLNRKKICIEKIFNKKKFSKQDLRETFVRAGVRKGMDVFIHSAWRQFYNFEGKPEDVISILEDLVGTNGTILMPANGETTKFLDVQNTPSHAGVITEIFRSQNKTIRSSSTHFPITARGKNAKELLGEHIKSIYGFDEYSPLYKLAQKENSMILFLGLSSTPTKISLFHCAGYAIKEYSPFLKHNVYTERYHSTLVVNGKMIEKDMVNRNPKYKNDNKVFKHIFNSLNSKEQVQISNLDVVSINAKEGLQVAIEYGLKGQYCYKLNKFV
ncbi:AAC(3) family N-acetyltransferase [Aerococcus urinaeequi]|uniref:AAC(3) family N-acetyltransferase n=1 Tax=Aerococcus urinaeequi TaxID=51665 RepID=UPI0022E8F463|nr:AAC(3) family N-acetyltransferase [Aerococcus urinaeequi]